MSSSSAAPRIAHRPPPVVQPHRPVHELKTVEGKDNNEVLQPAPILEIAKQTTPRDDRLHAEGEILYKDLCLPVHCIADCSAAVSVMNLELCKSLGLEPSPSTPVWVSSATGHKAELKESVSIQLRLTKDACFQQVSVFVHKEIPQEPYILVSCSDLRGYAVSFGKNAELEWIGNQSAREDSEIPESPEPPPFPDEVDSSALPAVQFGDFLSPSQKGEMERLVLEFRDIFGAINDSPAKPFAPFKVTLTPEAHPVRQRCRFLNLEKKEFVHSEIELGLKLGIFQESHSEWASPLTVTRKRNGKFRMCVDYTQVNAVTVRDAWPIPDPRDMFQFLLKKPFLASFDLSTGYYQAPVAPESRPILAFITPFGLYEPTRLPFGVTNGPPYFQYEVSHWLRPLKEIRSYFDDTVNASYEWSSFTQNIVSFFQLCRQDNVRLNAPKSIIGPTRIPILGRLVGPDSIEIDPERLQGLQDALPPDSKLVLQSFLGTAQWFQPFLPNLAQLAHPLWGLLRRNVDFVWKADHQQAWQKVKNAILSAPVLVHVVPGSLVILWPDASEKGIGGAILQRESGSEKLGLLAFASRKLTPAETRYPTIEQEALAVIFLLGKARPFITSHVLIETNHSNLQFMNSSANRRIQHWRLILAEFDITIKYRPGKTNAIADYLSRSTGSDSKSSPSMTSAAIHAISPSGEEVDDSETDSRNALQYQVRSIPQIMVEGVIVLEEKPSQDIINRVFALAHSDIFSGHCGRDRTCFRATAAIKWPGIYHDMGTLVQACPVCQKLHAKSPSPDFMASTRSRYPL
jgi:hypothetical protein